MLLERVSRVPGRADVCADEKEWWEHWALDHFLSPFFGGGAINLLYHVKTGLFYPRGSEGLDGWSLLWYEPWAEKRETSLGLWKKATAHRIISLAESNGFRFRDLL